MNDWWTSDNHFFHKKISTFCPETRKHHKCVEEMNTEMVDVWNSQVKPGDTVYILGDFSFGNSNKTETILKQLHGNLHLIKGNHDHWAKSSYLRNGYFKSVQDYKKIRIEDREVVMFHYPIYEWDGMQNGNYHLFGHTHGQVEIPGRAMDVGIDTWKNPDRYFNLYSWDDINKQLEQLPARSHH